MRWRKLGLIWKPKGDQTWARSHAMGPTPLLMPSGELRLFYSSLDQSGRGRPGWIDVDPSNPKQVLSTGEHCLLDVGRPGTFDENGVMVTSVISPTPGTQYLYYAGFELGHQIRYRILSGVAVSHDGGESFERVSETPMLERCEQELYFRGGPFVLQEGGKFRLWYVSGSTWTNIGGKTMPVYDLREHTSLDGLHWSGPGKISLKVTDADEHGFGRPWVTKGPNGYQLYYSIRRRSLGAYRLGYAESVDGLSWDRKDDQMGLDVGPDFFDDNAIMYAAVIESGGRTWCFYNGNDFGKDGIALAVLEA